MSVRWPRPFFYAVIVVVIVLDQLTKMWASASLEPLGSVTLVPGFFNLTYVRNTGIAFGMFAHQGLLVAGFVVLLALIAFYYTRSPPLGRLGTEFGWRGPRRRRVGQSARPDADGLRG